MNIEEKKTITLSGHKNIETHRRTMMRLYVSIQQELDMERFRTKLALELFRMTSQVLFHICLCVKRSVAY